MNEKLIDVIKREYQDYVERYHAGAKTNPDAVAHEIFYYEYFLEGWIRGAEWMSKKVTGKSLLELFLKG